MSLQRRKGYVNPVHRDSDIVKLTTPYVEGEEWQLTRAAAKYFKLECANSKAVKAYKVLKPDGFYISESLIPQATLDAHHAEWEVSGISLVDFLLLHTDSDSMQVLPIANPGEHLRLIDGYTCYRIHEMMNQRRKRILGFELWWHNKYEFDHITTVDILHLIKLSRMKKGN